MSDTDALTQIDAMRGVVALESGTGNAAALPGRTVIGKTGTSSDFKDAWFVGFTPQRATAVWVGYVKPGPLDGEGLPRRAGVRRHLPRRDLPRLHGSRR